MPVVVITFVTTTLKDCYGLYRKSYTGSHSHEKTGGNRVMKELLTESVYFGVTISIVGYGIGLFLKKKLKWAILNPLLI